MKGLGSRVPPRTIINPSHRSIDKALMERIDRLLMAMSEAEQIAYLSEAVYHERIRFERDGDEVTPKERDRVEGLARALTEGPEAMRGATARLVRAYSHEVHNRFSERTFSAAMRLAPAAIKRLLTPSESGGWTWPKWDGPERVVIQGPVEQLQALAEKHTLVFAPTHLSNLDSPLIGYALHLAGLPACTYGAGLNLFSSPIMGFLMSRLGAYTVDRRKRHRLYKDVLKAYSTELIGRGAHSLFYPGGTRSRTGELEGQVKRGLLGTAIAAWQEGLAEGRSQPEVLIVPITLSCSLVLEAETLIEDALAAAGKSRYIISDDEFSEPKTVLRYVRQLLDMDASVVVRFGHPMDVLGNSVDESGISLDGTGQTFDRRYYVCGRDSVVQPSAQRDRAYTNHLAEALCAAYRRDNVVLPSHLASYAAWHLLGARYPHLDTYGRALLSPFESWVDRGELVDAIARGVEAVDALVESGQTQALLPAGEDRAERVLTQAVETFSAFHSRCALDFEDWRVLVDPKLTLYYGNRLASLLSPTDLV
jgi:glycerol-3-phosphate O-acyltransferase